MALLSGALSYTQRSNKLNPDENFSIFPEVIRNSIDNCEFYRDNNFLYALISNRFFLDFSMASYLLSHEISKCGSTSKCTFTMEIFLDVLLVFTKRLKSCSTTDVEAKKSKIVSIIDAICSMIDFKICAKNDSLTSMVLSISNEIFDVIKMFGHTISVLNVLCPRIAALARTIVESVKDDHIDIDIDSPGCNDSQSTRNQREKMDLNTVTWSDE